MRVHCTATYVELDKFAIDVVLPRAVLAWGWQDEGTNGAAVVVVQHGRHVVAAVRAPQASDAQLALSETHNRRLRNQSGPRKLGNTEDALKPVPWELYSNYQRLATPR